MTALLVIATIILFLVIDWAVQHRKARAAARQLTPQELAGTYPLRTPNGIFFAKSHTWVNLFPSGRVQIGLDDFVGRLLQKPSVVFLRKEADTISKGDPILELQEGERKLTIRSPLSGEIVGLNQGLAQNPSLMKDSLFAKGWAVAIMPTQPEELKALALGGETGNWMQEEFRRLREFLGGLAGGTAQPVLALQDGGAPVTGALLHLDDAGWERFEDEFLRVS